MRDYALMVKILRSCAENSCEGCPIGGAEYTSKDCRKVHNDAADAIEELLAEKAKIENSGKLLAAAFERLKSKVPRWISVEERLPEKHVEVLICTEDYGKTELGFATVAVWDGSEWIEAWNRKESIPYVSHWMPLPVPPKEDAE